MFLSIRKKFWYLFAATLALAGLMIFLHLSPVFALRGTEVNGPLADKLTDIVRNAAPSGTNLFRFDSKSFARRLLAHTDVDNVKLSFSLPDSIRADVNGFEPTALVMTGTLCGLDRHCRLIPYDPAWHDIDVPVLTGLAGSRLFQAPRDFRVVEVMEGLMQVKNEMPDLYRQIAEIDFSDRVYVSIYLTTGTDQYLACSRDFASQLIKLDAVTRTVARSDDGCYNLQYDGVVIKQR